MQHGLPDQLLFDLSECVAGQMGLHFPRERWRELEIGLQSAARALGVADVASWTHSLLSAPLTKAQVEILARELTIGETYFLREKRGFAIVAEHILPELIRARRRTGQRLRIWSAGCCTGEEPYSIAILLDRILPDLNDWQVTILATDINPRFLQKAAEGVFSEWSFRDAPPWLRESYFQPVAGRHLAILPRIRQRVTFAYLNLAEDIYPSLASNTNAMDLIFCRNVLMYFAPERAGKVVDNFSRSLVEGGWLVVSAVETSSRLFSRFVSVPFDGAILYQKRDESSPTLPAVFPSGTTLTSGHAGIAASLSMSFAAPAAVPQSAPDAEPLDAPASATPRAPQTTGDKPTGYEAALALYEQGKYAQAALHLREHFAAGPPTVESAGLLARIHANLGELSQARWWAEHAIAADKINAASHYLRALILQEQGIPEEALDSLKRTLYLAPDFLLAHFALGNIARQRGRRKEADRHFTSALTLLKEYGDNDLLPHSDGLAAGRLRQMIQSLMHADISA